MSAAVDTSTRLPDPDETPAPSTDEKAGLTASQPIEEELQLPLSSKDGIVSKPFGRPLEGMRPIARPALTAEENLKYQTLLKKVSAWTEIPTKLASNSPKAAFEDHERMFLTREGLLRYLRATKWNVDSAEKRLRDTLTWRREYGADRFTSDYVSIEGETGKQVITGFDINARPCLYLMPSRQNTERLPRQIHFLVFMLDRLIDLMPPGQESVTLLINFNETKNGQGATIAQARETMYILQNHYPERLGRACVTSLPWYIKTFFSLISAFIDPNTREKIKFNEDMSKHVPATQLLKEVGGQAEMKWDHSQYWPALMKLAESKRTAYRERWEKAGKKIGEHEDYLRGGEGAKSLSETEQGIEELMAAASVKDAVQ